MKVLVIVLVLAGGHPDSGVSVSVDSPAAHTRTTGQHGRAVFRLTPGHHRLLTCGGRTFAVHQRTVRLTIRCVRLFPKPPRSGSACTPPPPAGPLPPLGEARHRAELMATGPITSEVARPIAGGGAEVTYEGTFVDYLAPVPPGYPAPKGTKLTLTLDPQGRVFMEHLYDGGQATC
jgi:hypothetical protein